MLAPRSEVLANSPKTYFHLNMPGYSASTNPHSALLERIGHNTKHLAKVRVL